jgi:hypothetical protein
MLVAAAPTMRKHVRAMMVTARVKQFSVSASEPNRNALRSSSFLRA